MTERDGAGFTRPGHSGQPRKGGGKPPEPASRWGIPLIFLAVIAALWLGFRMVPDLSEFLVDVPILSPSATSEPKVSIPAVADASPTPAPAPTAAGQAPQASPTPRTTMPNLIQSSEERAIALLEQHELAAAVEQVYSDSVAPGRVVSQSPEPNTEVPAGQTVIIRISQGPEFPTMPDVVGTAVDNARQQLELLDVAVEEVEQGSDTVAAGRVLAQEPAAGVAVEPGTTVRLTVSAGVDRVVVPDVRGRQLAIAQQELATLGLRGTLGITLTEDTGTCGTVASQSQPPGVQVDRNTEVSLNVRGSPGCTGR